jgi:hypothetical protein
MTNPSPLAFELVGRRAFTDDDFTNADQRICICSRSSSKHKKNDVYSRAPWRRMQCRWYAAAPEPTSRPLTNVNTADAAVETRTLVDENPPRKKQFSLCITNSKQYSSVEAVALHWKVYTVCLVQVLVGLGYSTEYGVLIHVTAVLH